MRVKMLRSFNALKVGQTAEVGDGVAEFWIQCGRAQRMVPTETIEVRPSKPTRTQRTRAHLSDPVPTS